MPYNFDPNSQDSLFSRILLKLDAQDKLAGDRHTEFMDRFNKHEKVDDARHESNTTRLERLEDSKKKVIYGFGGLTFVGAVLHFLIDLIHPHGK